MFHKEGYTIILITLIFVAVGVIAAGNLISNFTTQKIIQSILIILALLVLQFFRNPNRHTVINDHHIIAPADGKVVIVEEVEEP